MSDIVLLKDQAELDGVDHRASARMQYPVTDGGEIQAIAIQQHFQRLADVEAYDIGDISVEVKAPLPGISVPVEPHGRPLFGNAEALEINHARRRPGWRRSGAVLGVGGQHGCGRTVAEKAV